LVDSPRTVAHPLSSKAPRSSQEESSFWRTCDLLKRAGGLEQPSPDQGARESIGCNRQNVGSPGDRGDLFNNRNPVGTINAHPGHVVPWSGR